MTDSSHNCDALIRASAWAMSLARAEGDRWRCFCEKVFVHICDEAEGCSWAPL